MKFDTDLQKFAKKISLKATERRELRERVLSYMEYHPLPKQAVSRETLVEGLPSESFITLHFNSLYGRIAGGFVVLLLVMAPFVAERAVPGDVLYLVKTGINEPIRGQMANSPYEKIEFETKLMERRIAEARVLASEGKLTEEVKAQITEDVKDHTVAVQDGLAELRTQDADGAAIAQIAFSSSLEVQSAVLGVNESTNSTSSVDSILSVVNEAHDQIVSNQVTESASFESLNAQVELETTRALELFATVKQSATEEEIGDIERRLSDIDRLILESKEKHVTDPDTAVDNLANTLGLIQKLILFMTDIDVRETVTLDTIVPVVLSSEERMGLVREELARLTKLEKDITARTVDVDIDVAGSLEKVEEGLTMSDDLLVRTALALETSDIDTAERTIKEAQALLADLDVMTIAYVDPEIPLPEVEVVTATSSATTTDPNTEVGTSTPVVE